METKKTIPYEMKPLDKGDGQYIEKMVDAYVNSVAPPDPGAKEEYRVFKIEDGDGALIAGCIVEYCAWNWGRMLIETLWVDERYRGQGMGSMLIRAAEREGRERGCYLSCLGTLDFQARGLYEKHGYMVFSSRKNLPEGHEDYSMCKRLDRDIPDYVPVNNTAAERYEIKFGGEQDADVIDDGLDRHNERFVQQKHGYIPLNRKLVDEQGRMIAGIVAGIGVWDNCFINALWVEEPYRRQGLGSLLLHTVEREAKEKGAVILMTNAGDWNVGYFERQDFTVSGELRDFPTGHTCYELQKNL